MLAVIAVFVVFIFIAYALNEIGGHLMNRPGCLALLGVAAMLGSGIILLMLSEAAKQASTR